MGWFGPSQEEVWRQLCDKIGAEFITGGLWKGNKVQSRVGPWTITLDTFTTHSEHHHSRHTRIRAPYVNPSGFRFKIYRKGFFSDLGKLLGMQDIEVGDPALDEAFIIQANDEARVHDLLRNPSIRDLILIQPQFRLEVCDGESWFVPRFPPDVDELKFQVVGVIKDVGRLKALFDLFAAVLEELCRIGSAYRSTPDVTL